MWTKGHRNLLRHESLASDIDRQFHAAAIQLRLRHAMALATSFNFRLLNGIRLQKRIEVLLRAPTASVVIVLQLAR